MIDKRLFKLNGIISRLFTLTIMTGIQGLAILIQGITLASAIVNCWQGKPIKNALIAICIFAIAFIIRQLLVVIKNQFMSAYADNAVEIFRRQLLAKYTALGSTLTVEQGTGNAVTMLGVGLDNVKNYFQLLLIKLFDLAIIPWIILLYIFYIKWEQGLFLLLIFPVIIMFFIILGLAAQSKADAEFANFKNLNNRFVDALRGLPTLKQLGLADIYGGEIYNISEDYRKTTMRTLRIAMTSTFALDFFTTLSIAVVAVFLGFDLLDGHMTLFPALATLILAPEYFLPLRNFSDDYHATLNGKNALTDVLEMIDQPEMINKNSLNLESWSPNSQLSFKNINFSYDTQNVLKDITTSIHGYQKIAIVGESGSGKSTLLNLIAGFLQPTSGSIRINEQSLDHLAQKDWQKQFFYMPQQPYIFHDTLKHNISFYAPDATDEAIKKAVIQAGLSDLVSELKLGLETVIGESGRQVSGGQAQRIALARLLLDSKRKILLFDEPTAHLDIETEYDLKQTMTPIMSSRLVFFATHRLHWLDQMDYVLVMQKGEIVEVGEPRTLISNKNSRLNQLRYHLRGEK
ncbi:thiol reductant ABC exporter subunit CydD [Leuconostoc palmae]|uniref:thiol reductant ABC exporter subunit CydD n=1 Tax=Leuconostoc palmae TaxID=501487 RepID=UPI001C7E076A|nr:thiol reductant ABC exporter subunit CydD [Leuconostoc palmae]